MGASGSGVSRGTHPVNPPSPVNPVKVVRQLLYSCMEPIELGPARFDSTLGAWVLSSYADVAAALREPRLSASDGGDEEGAHAAVREAAVRALAPARLAAWRAEL